MIERRNNCIGIKLFRLGRRQLELWFCRKGEIESHCHPHIDCTLIFLFGAMLGTIGDKVGMVENYDSFRRFRILSGMNHSAKILSFTAFLNWETWDIEPTSAAIDFQAI